MKNNKVNEWLKIDARLQKKLKELELLNQERDFLIAKAEKQKVLTAEMQNAMKISLTKYTQLANEIAVLKKQSQALSNNN